MCCLGFGFLFVFWGGGGCSFFSCLSLLMLKPEVPLPLVETFLKL